MGNKVAVKTIGWAAVSGGIFFVSAIIGGSDMKTAAIATGIAVAAKTPAYTAFEWAVETWYKRV